MNIQTTTILHDEKTTEKMMCRLSDEELALCRDFGMPFYLTREQLDEMLQRTAERLQNSCGEITRSWQPYHPACEEL